MKSPQARPLRVVLVDMNAGHRNEAMRCFRSIVARFFDTVWTKNPGLTLNLREVSPRDTGHPIPRDGDLYVCSGGPGSPFESDGTTWGEDFALLVEDVVDGARAGGADAQALFGVCYTFELLVKHFGIAQIRLRETKKLGVMPVYSTPEGMNHPLISPFGDRFFAFEHRSWEVTDVNLDRLRALGGSVLALESRDGVSKGRGIEAIDFGSGIEAVQFHPEGDVAGAESWLLRPDVASSLREAYGEEVYDAMLHTLSDPSRVERLHNLMIPGWLSRKFNLLALSRGYSQI